MAIYDLDLVKVSCQFYVSHHHIHAAQRKMPDSKRRSNALFSLGIVNDLIVVLRFETRTNLKQN